MKTGENCFEIFSLKLSARFCQDCFVRLIFSYGNITKILPRTISLLQVIAKPCSDGELIVNLNSRDLR